MARFTCLALAVLAGAAPLPAGARDLPVLDVYTYDSFAAEWGPGPQLKAGFERMCGCTLRFTAFGDSITTLRRVQLEGPASGADVVVGLDTATAGDARATGLFAGHGLDLPAFALPEPWADPDFVPFDYGYFAYVYNTETVPNPPASFEALIALPDDFKIVIQDPRASTPGLGHVLWIKAAYGDRAAEIWAGLRPHILTVTAGWSEAYSLFLSGEADMVLSYSTSPAYHAIAEKDERFAFAEFTEGHVPQVEVAGVLKSTDQPDLARAFLSYLVSAEAQAILPVTNWMYPVIDIGEALPAAFGTRPVPANVLSIDEADLRTHGRAWIEEALDALQ